MIPSEHLSHPQEPEREHGQPQQPQPPSPLLLLRSSPPRIPSPKRRGRRRRSLLLVLPMAMIVLGASPSRPLSLNNHNNARFPSFRGGGPGVGDGTRDGGGRRATVGLDVPFGPLPRGGSCRDLTVYNYHWTASSCSSSSSSAAAVATAAGGDGYMSVAGGNRGPFAAVRSASRKLRRSVLRLAVRSMNVNANVNINVSRIVSNINLPTNFKIGLPNFNNHNNNHNHNNSNHKKVRAVMETVDTLDGWGNVHDLAFMEVTSSQSSSSSWPETAMTSTSRRNGNHRGKQIKVVRQSPPKKQKKLLPLSGMGRVFYRSSKSFGRDVHGSEQSSIASAYEKAAQRGHDEVTASSLEKDGSQSSQSRGSSSANFISNAGVGASAAVPIRGGGSEGRATAPKSPTTNTVTQSDEISDGWIIDTPFFPIILPKGWEPPSVPRSLAPSAIDSRRDVTFHTQSNKPPPSPVMEISVHFMRDQRDRTSSEAEQQQRQQQQQVDEEPPPSQHLLRAATLPLIPKATFDSFTGREFYRYETIEGLVRTGLRIAGGSGVDAASDGRDASAVWNVSDDVGIVWTGEKKTVKFLNDFPSSSSLRNREDPGNDDSTGDDDVDGIGRATAIPSTQSKIWYDALESSQEVLVWTGKFTDPTTHNGNGNLNEGYGADIPIIKTTSIVHRSPKFLAELLMDSEKVKVYNKMSLGRTDEMVFQKGVDTVGGRFGDGETKVVRNLTKPPMVNSILEFVTCMHARQLRPDDTSLLSNNNNNHNRIPTEGYIVVSRAVTGGKWNAGETNNHHNGEKFVRNEILLGVNILKAVPGEPNKTELTSVTHVYSPMIPLMLAKNAGVKGAVDFVRDIRALP